MRVTFANGTHQDNIPACKVGLVFDGYAHEHSAYMLDTPAEFDIILGQDWISKHSADLMFSCHSLAFTEQGSFKKHIVPVPPHLKDAQLNSLINNTIAEIQKSVHTGTNQTSDNPVTHMFMVYVSESSDLINSVDYQQAVAASISIDNMQPHTVPSTSTNANAATDQDSDLHVHTEALRADIKQLVEEFKDRFPQDLPAGLPPYREGVAHAIPIKPGEHTPPAKRLYRLTVAEKEEVEKKVADLLEKGWIQPSHSPYGAPILFVAKKDGGLRMVVDYRAVNQQTVKNKYPLPRIDDLFDQLQGAKLFTCLDLQQAYHQVRLREEDIPKTAFCTHRGQYEYRVLSFGLTNAPATFQTLMNNILAPYIGKFCLVYLDDILVFSKTPGEHLEHLRAILQAFRHARLYAKLSKCKFALTEVPFLGHIVSGSGISPDPSKVKVVQDWKRPTNVAEVRSFLGLSQYFAKFIDGYATLTVPLSNLLRKNVPWQWTDACEHAFQGVKHALIHAPVLTLPDPELPFEVVTDACKTGVGAVLLQQGKPIAFAGRKLSDAETRYTVTDQELLGVMYALTQWRCYLQGAKHDFTIVTDHNPNTYFATQPNLNARQVRWSEKLQEYHFNWQYRPGRNNVADPVSRQMVLTACITTLQQFGHYDWIAKSHDAPGVADALCNHSAFVSAVLHNAVRRKPESSHAHAVTTRSQAQQQEINAELQQPEFKSPAQERNMLDSIRAGYVHDQQCGDPNKPSRQWAHMYPEHGLWMHHTGAIVVPDHAGLRQDIIAELHDSLYAGHPGMRRTILLVRRYFWWPTLDRDCREFVRGCAICQRDKATTRKIPGMLQQPVIPEGKWHTISMDFITTLPVTPRGHNMILTVIDTFSKLCHLIPCHDSIDAKGTAELLFAHVFSKHGVPKRIISDRDTRFTSDVFQSVMRMLSTDQAMSTAHHPQTDGQTERLNRVVEETLRHYVNNRQDDWDNLLPCAEFAINNTFHDSIQTTPFHLNFGYHPTLPVDIRISDNAVADSFLHEKQQLLRTGKRYFAAALAKFNAEHLASLVAQARVMIDAAKQRQKRYADQHRIPVSYEPEQEVMLSTKHLTVTSVPSKKLFPSWLGPMTIDKQIGPNAYRLRIPGHWRMHNVFNVSVLKPWHDNGMRHPPPPWTLLKGQNYIFEVDTILDHHPKHFKPSMDMPQAQLRGLTFLVRWRFYGPEFDTWEPYLLLKNAPESLTAYFESL